VPFTGMPLNREVSSNCIIADIFVSSITVVVAAAAARGSSSRPRAAYERRTRHRHGALNEDDGKTA